MGRYHRLDDIALADCAIDVSARTLDDLFETAAGAVADTMVAPGTLAGAVSRRLTLTGPTLEMLLYDWLSELIAVKDASAEVFPRTEVAVTGPGPYQLHASLQGGRIVPGRTERRADPKGVTLHRFVLEPSEEGWHARFVVDL